MIDYSIVITSILSAIVNNWYLLPIILLLIFFKTPLGKGLFGEFLVNLAINIKLDKRSIIY